MEVVFSNEKMILPACHSSVHVFHGTSMPFKPFAVKFIAPQANLFKQAVKGRAQLLKICEKLCAGAVSNYIHSQKLDFKCFSCGAPSTQFSLWNFIYVETPDKLNWNNYGACKCDNEQCSKVIDERIRGWVNTGKNTICEINE